MGLEQYELEENKSQTTFHFISEGQKGKILKRIRYSKMPIQGVIDLYNLGFGDVDPQTGKVNDLTVTGNGDRDKVLATVVKTVFIFMSRYPVAKIFIAGSTPSRTRLYQMAISNYLEVLSETFEIEGLSESGFESFQKDSHYIAFLIKRK
jgi:hypothetical protein